MRILSFAFSMLVSLGLFTGTAWAETAAMPTSAASSYEAVLPNKDKDLRIFYADGKVVTGSAALEKMNEDAVLILWLAGNQFFAMQDVIQTVQKKNPKVGNVALITRPPGILLKAITKGGWSYEGKEYPMQRDIYTSVDIDHIKTLKAKSMMDNYMIYIHNALALMVA